MSFKVKNLNYLSLCLICLTIGITHYRNYENQKQAVQILGRQNPLEILPNIRFGDYYDIILHPEEAKKLSDLMISLEKNSPTFKLIYGRVTEPVNVSFSESEIKSDIGRANASLGRDLFNKITMRFDPSLVKKLPLEELSKTVAHEGVHIEQEIRKCPEIKHERTGANYHATSTWEHDAVIRGTIPMSKEMGLKADNYNYGGKGNIYVEGITDTTPFLKEIQEVNLEAWCPRIK
jgi:hypothetical protein